MGVPDVQPQGLLSRLSRSAMSRRLLAPVLALLFTSASLAQTSRPGQPQQPARDTPAQQDVTPPPTGRITGRVVASDNGRPIKRARAYVSAPELPEGRGTLTDDSGVFELPELPPGRYTLTVSKTGFVALSYGQRRPFMAGTPLQLGDGQQMGGIEIRLPRGSVIAGHILDETGDPMPGATVRVMNYQYAQGERQLVPAGTAQTDDEGGYRVWGLNPGDYYVSAVSRNFNFGARAFGGPGGGRGGPLGGRGGAGGRGAVNSRGIPLDPNDGDETQKAYAPTYYPGVGSVNEARSITVGVGQQSLDINFNLLLVRTAHVKGTVTNPDGSPTTSGQVSLTPEGVAGGGRGQIGANFGGRIDWDGTFEVANVPPGRYTLRARGTDTESPQFAAQPLTVASGDLSNITVILYPGATISGTIRFDGTQSPEFTQVRVNAPSAEGASVGPNPNARVDKDGHFTLDGVSAGSHWIRSAGQLRGWTLRSVIVGGRDVIDTPLDLRSNQKLNDVTLVFTNKLTQIAGTVANEQSMPVTDFTVLAFPTDPSLWRPLARQIMTARPDQNGKYQIRGLPPGDYYLVTVDPGEQGEWFEPAFLDQHRIGAPRVLLGDGDIKTHDFHISTR
jgi:Carboxypeptidase regulatory-like domain